MPSRALKFLTARRTRVYLAWAALLIAVGHRAGQGWVNFRQADRPVGNDGHTSIDFGGQWMLGRLLSFFTRKKTMPLFPPVMNETEVVTQGFELMTFITSFWCSTMASNCNSWPGRASCAVNVHDAAAKVKSSYFKVVPPWP